MQSLKDYRETKGVKQLAVANYLGISRQTYASYETNQESMSVGQARAICKYLGCAMEDIFDLEVKTINVTTDHILGREEVGKYGAVNDY